ncbi:hypothetical protein OG871_18450 [Kitasatospora sp. NBC_00374]|uniref:hypothetical protein n=1 Tax=Kitasatospora sp. NBC_00374 TaxID=2975964 RepID=UPI003244BE3D
MSDQLSASDPEQQEEEHEPRHEPDPVDDSEPTHAAPRTSRRSTGRGRRAVAQLRSRRLLGPAAGLVAVCLAVAVAWVVPASREVLRQSFTKQSSPFTELYFTSEPTFEGATVVVPVAVNAHGTGIKSFQLDVVLEGPGGKPVTATTLPLTPRDGTAVPLVARLATSNADVAVVRVALKGHPQKLHFRFGKPQAAEGKA